MNPEVAAQQTRSTTPVVEFSVVEFCVFLSVAATLATGQLFGFGGFIPQLAQQFGPRVSLGLPLFAIGYALGMIMLGSLGSVVGSRRLMIISLCLGGVLSIALSAASSVLVVLGLRFVEGVVLGGFPPAAFLATVQRVPPQKRLFANSAMVFGLLGSAGVAGLITTTMLLWVSWHTGFLIYGVLLLGAGIAAWCQAGLAAGVAQPRHPYLVLGVELANSSLLLSMFFGATTMAAFVFVNGNAQRSTVATLALVLVIVTVLVILAFARRIIQFDIDVRRLLGLSLAAIGLGIFWFSGGLVLLLLLFITSGATLTIPANIQAVIAHAKNMVPVAVSLFTCSLFLGGFLAGIAVTGVVQVELSVVSAVITGLLLVALVLATVRWFRAGALHATSRTTTKST